jgi:hypothetical protein
MTSSYIKGVDLGGVKVLVDTTMRILRLVTSTNTAVDTCTLLGVAYQVPVGKKTTITNIVEIAGVSTWLDTNRIIYADNSGGTTNQVNMIVGLVSGSNAILITDSAPAGKYINKNSDNSARSLTFYAVEENA